MKKIYVPIEFLFFSLLAIILFFVLVNIDVTKKDEGLLFESEKIDTLGVLLLKINIKDSTIYKRINLTPITYDEYCILLQTIVNEGICDIEIIDEYY